MNNFIETITLSRESYDKLQSHISDLAHELNMWKNDMCEIEKELDGIADENHALKKLLLETNMAGDWTFKENSLERVLDFTSPFCGIDYAKLKAIKNFISDEEIEIAIEMRWRKLNDKKEDDNVRF